MCAQDIDRVEYFYTSIVSKCKIPAYNTVVSAVGKSTSKHT